MLRAPASARIQSAARPSSSSPTVRHACPAVVVEQDVERARIREAHEDEVGHGRTTDHERRHPGLRRERVRFLHRRLPRPQRLAEPFERDRARAADADRQRQRTGHRLHPGSGRSRDHCASASPSPTPRCDRASSRRRSGASAPFPTAISPRLSPTVDPARSPAETRSSAPGSASTTRPSPRPRAHQSATGPPTSTASPTGIEAIGLRMLAIPPPTTDGEQPELHRVVGREVHRRSRQRSAQPDPHSSRHRKPGARPQPADPVERRRSPRRGGQHDRDGATQRDEDRRRSREPAPIGHRRVPTPERTVGRTQRHEVATGCRREQRPRADRAALARHLFDRDDRPSAAPPPLDLHHEIHRGRDLLGDRLERQARPR